MNFDVEAGSSEQAEAFVGFLHGLMERHPEVEDVAGLLKVAELNYTSWDTPHGVRHVIEFGEFDGVLVY